MQRRGCRVGVGVARKGLQSWGGGCKGGVAQVGLGLQRRGCRVGVGVAMMTLHEVLSDQFFATPTPTLRPLPCNSHPNSATSRIQHIKTTLQPLVCNPHPNSATPALQPSPQVCARSFATATLTLQPFLCHPRRRARKPKNLESKRIFTCKISF